MSFGDFLAWNFLAHAVTFGDFMAGNFMARDFLAGDFLAHHVTFGDFLAGNFLAGDFLGGYPPYAMFNNRNLLSNCDILTNFSPEINDTGQIWSLWAPFFLQ